MFSLRFATRLALAALFFAVPAAAQSWPTTDWTIVREDGEPLTTDQQQGARFYRQQLQDASRWYQAAGFRAPRMIRENETSGPYVGYISTDTTSLGAVYRNERGEYSDAWLDWAIENIVDYFNPGQRFYLSGHRGAWTPTTKWETTMSYGPAHELFHAVQAAYGRPSGAPSGSMCTSLGGQPGIGSTDWAWEGMASAVQIRYLERARGVTFEHPYKNPQFAAWTRYFDHPVHQPRHSKLPTNSTLSWYCGYGSWYFWYAMGDMLGDTPEEKIGFLQYVLSAPGDWSDYGIAKLDAGLRRAAQEYDSRSRYDEGLYELYPAFIAEYADDERFYQIPDAVYLRGRSEVKWRNGVIAPIETKAFTVTINIDDNQPRDRPSRFRVTLDPQPNREQLHLIEGTRVIQPALSDVDPYQFEIPIYRDTTVLVRLANVAEDAPATEGTQFSARFELGGFYGAPASGPYVAPDVDIPPGFNVMSGPPELISCQGGADGGSVFDLITAAEATGDVRRMVDGGQRMLDNMEEALDDGEFYIPGMTAQQREAMERAVASGAISEAQLAEMRAAVREAQGEMGNVRQSGAEAQAELSREYENRSRLIMTLVGRVGNETCQILISAGLQGEEGGAQQLSVEDPDDYDSDGPLPVGISNVGWLVGSIEDMVDRDRSEDLFDVCMMTPEEQQRERESSCPAVCSGGRLILEEASQGHAKGTLRVDLLRTRDNPNGGCPRVERRELVVGFNITSANHGQDADMLRGISDETLRAMGMDESQINAMRQFDGMWGE